MTDERKVRLTETGDALAVWLVVMPARTALAAYALMIGFGALHGASAEVWPAIGWWTSVGISFAINALLKVFGGWGNDLTKKVKFVRNS